ncbi:adenylate/guanylate cyclase domain-containing protein [Dongia sedimenti]|uniref:Adenylate/guanylate cyclase domain-containing protein n=1 Tax=Dongia sedimenti TaxID=3064282 RepID=A0ABU0YQU2_9PROT|nr:adenylate/guanylate cyclase domain-containing protein [Rhodospirillaceae bacterium R-7]
MAAQPGDSSRDDPNEPLVDSDPNRRSVIEPWRPARARGRRATEADGLVAPAEIAQLFAGGEAGGRAFRWLLNEGRRLPDLADVVAGLGRQLTEGGLPLQRLYLGQRTIHPQMGAIGYLWNKGDETAQIIEREHSVVTGATYLTSPMRRLYEDGEKLIRRKLVGPEAQLDFPVLHELAETGATDYAIFLLEIDDDARASISMTTNAPQGFSDAEIASVGAVMPLLAMVVESREWHRLAKSLLEIYLGEDAGRQVLGGSVRRGQAMTIAAAIWFCDLRDFTAMSNQLPRDEVIALLNDYFDAMARPVHAHGGEILKFIGDAMLAIFPMQDDLDRDNRCHVALRAAHEAFDALDALNEIRASAGKPPLRAGIGLHAGSVSYGNIGAVIGNSARLDFTAIGPAVNLASRIQDLCRGLNRPLLASKAFASPCGSLLVPLGKFDLAGFPEPQEIYGLPD